MREEVRCVEIPVWMRRRSTDYGRTVAFPVAVVGRDGRVRHCDFDESVRMYARRLHVAAARASDTERARDEVEHCRARLEQLRRSYLERHAHAVLGSPTNVWGTLLAADLLGFLHRCFPGSIDALVVEPLAGEDPAYVRVGTRWGFVQAWALGGSEAQAAAARSSYYVAWEVLASAARPDAAAPDTEQLWAAWHSPDVAVLLSGIGRWEGTVPEVHEEAPTHEEAWGAAVEAAWKGRTAEALSRFEAMVADRPEALAIAQAAALMAMAEGRPERAAFHAEGGLLRAPDDVTLRGVRALAHARGRTAAPPSSGALALGPGADDHRDAPERACTEGLLGATQALDALALGRFLGARQRIARLHGPLGDVFHTALRAYVLRWCGTLAALLVLAATGILSPGAAVVAACGTLGVAAAELVVRARATLRGERLGLVRIDFTTLLPRLYADPHRPT